MTQPDFEKLGAFYLGRPYDLRERRPLPGWLLYDARDLVTHAVCIGMTGSGKTGLCLALLEEALLDGIPALIIDPKGDLANLLLTFPDLAPADFAPWVNAEDARRAGQDVDAYAAQQAQFWARGLAEWGQDGDRIRRLRAAADFAVYTPGSEAGLPLSILRSFAAPGPAVLGDKDLLRERISTVATSLLSLAGVDAEPLRSREHILISTILDAAWTGGRDLDLAALIGAIQTPPVTRLGALDLEAFYPSRDRFALAAQVNNVLAAPGFGAWLLGDPIDVDALLHTPEGKSRAAIVSIAHLGDAERMFLVSILLNEVLAWMRAQPGTTSLRAILYMDEIFGFFPPVANPPSKPPLLTLLKQARAYGLGVVLTTQNPVDLDYKGLGNTGTWFIGRLQTERDKARVMEGLEGVAAGAGARFDRAAMEEVLTGLGNRVFLLNNVHEDAPVIFQTRWCMSYLRGPLTRAQIKTLMDPRKRERARAGATRAAGASPAGAAADAAPGHAARAAATPPTPAGDLAAMRPVLPPEVPQHVVPVRGAAPAGADLVYRPMLLGAARVRFADTKLRVDETEELVLLAPFGEGAVAVSWDDTREARLGADELEAEPRTPARFVAPPTAAAKPRSYEAWRKEFAAWLASTRQIALYRHPASRQVSRPGESERDFRIRLGDLARADRDQRVEALRKKYAPRLAALEERLRRARQAVAREQEQVTHQGLQTAISVGATILGAFLGRKAVSAGTVGRATTAARSAGRVLKERQDVGRSAETVGALERQEAELDAQFQAELAQVEGLASPPADALETLTLYPKKTHVTVSVCALAWAPHWHREGADDTPAWS
jgi:hypothetical protein